MDRSFQVFILFFMYFLQKNFVKLQFHEILFLKNYFVCVFLVHITFNYFSNYLFLLINNKNYLVITNVLFFQALETTWISGIRCKQFIQIQSWYSICSPWWIFGHSIFSVYSNCVKSVTQINDIWW